MEPYTEKEQKIVDSLTRMALKQLKILTYMSNVSNATVTSQNISQDLKLDKVDTGAQMSALSKMYVGDEKIIEPKGRTPEGLRWKLNDNLKKSKHFKETIDTILSE